MSRVTLNDLIGNVTDYITDHAAITSLFHIKCALIIACESYRSCESRNSLEVHVNENCGTANFFNESLVVCLNLVETNK